MALGTIYRLFCGWYDGSFDGWDDTLCSILGALEGLADGANEIVVVGNLVGL